LITALLPAVSCSPPAIKRPYEIIEATIEGSEPLTVDPAFCYDTASGELLMNVYDTLVFLDGEQVDRYMPQLSTEWTIENITGVVSPEGLPWYFRYTFKIRENVPFHDSAFGFLIPADVEYCFERAMVLDMDGGPQWMFYEPLLNSWGALGLNSSALPNDADTVMIGKMIDHAIESNSTHVWFNLAFPGAYPPFMQILSEPWSSIYSKAWTNSLNRASNWPGEWGNYTDWWTYHNPSVPPLDDPTPTTIGTGPFVLEVLDRTARQWSANRFVNYWRGWPADWPTTAGSQPRGYVNHIVVTWSYDWNTRSAMFLNGDVDFCAVPRGYIAEALGKPGIRCIYPLHTMSVDALFYNFNVSQTSPYGPILAPENFNELGIPSDFFGNSSWGVHVRKAFSYAIDYDNVTAQMYLGEATRPVTAIIPGLPYYDPTIKGYSYNLTRAADEFKQVPNLWDTGFTIQIVYNVGSTPRPAGVIGNLLKSAIESMNPKFHVTVAGVAWSYYLHAMDTGQLTVLTLGWLADYPDPHDFACVFYGSRGDSISINPTFAKRTGYVNLTIDALIEAGIRTPNGPERAAIYRQIQQLVVDDCPSVPIAQVFSRHFERDWVVGWYYNPGVWLSSGNYLYNVWKWYYIPFSLSDTQPLSNNRPTDVNYDGIVNIIDITVIGQAFASSFGPPLHPRWNFRADVNDDRLINIVDIGLAARYFSKASAPWASPS